MSTVVDNTNSNIVWTGASWRNQNRDDDPLVDRYFNSTFRHSVNSGDYASIWWKGSDIAIYGARRDNHGIYSVSIDAGEPEYFSGFASGEGQFQAVLFATTGLATGDHTLKIANENSRNIEQYPKYTYLDVDYFALTGELLPPAGGTPPPSSSFSSSAASSSPSSTASIGPSSAASGITSSSAITSPEASTDGQPTSASPTDPASSDTSPSSSASGSESGSGSASGSESSSQSEPPSQINVTNQFTETPASSRPVTATEGVESVHTTGTPNIVPQTTQSGTVAGAASDPADDGSSSSNKTTIAVSVSVISVAVVVICTVLGLYLYKKRKTKREMEEASQQDHMMAERDWQY